MKRTPHMHRIAKNECCDEVVESESVDDSSKMTGLPLEASEQIVCNFLLAETPHACCFAADLKNDIGHAGLELYFAFADNVRAAICVAGFLTRVLSLELVNGVDHNCDDRLPLPDFLTNHHA